MTAPTSSPRAAYRPWSVRTVVVRLSRKLSATYRIRSDRRLSRLLATLLAAVSPWATALPEGAQVVAGQASVSTPSANAMVVNQTSDKAVLNWQSFNIGVGQSMQFVQPGASSVALNRVIGNGASSIFGSLSANGQVFLINPSGVMFAPGAQVNVGGLVASSLDIGNGDFMAGRYTFSGNGSGPVDNHGSINIARGGYVLLAAPQVNNTGAITADAGSVGLLAGSRVSVDTSGTGLVRFSVDAAAAQAAITNSGSITATGGQVAVLASAMGDALATVINQSGVIRANSAVERNGTILLSGGGTGVVHVTGELSAAGVENGQTGGTVKVLGDKVGLAGTALIDVSGDAGGGTALVGGNYQGRGPEQNATATFVGEQVRIDASAHRSGDGGKVVVWADDTTRFGGRIAAHAGSDAGNGGMAEVSGKRYLDYNGFTDLTAANGSTGTLLLDPSNITISSVADSGGLGAGPTFESGTGTANLNVGTLLGQLAGANVIVNTSPGTGGTGNITVSNNIAYTGATARSLTLNADGNIAINAAITSTAASLSTNLNAVGTTAFGINGSLSTFGGDVVIAGAAKTLRSITTTGGIGTGNLTISGTGAVSQTSGALVIKGATSVTAGAANSVTLNTATNDFQGDLSVVSGNNVSLRDANALVLGASNVSGTLTVVTAGAVTQSGALSVTGATSLTAGAANDITLNNAANNFGGAVSTVSGRNVALTDANALTLGASTVSGTLGVNTTGAIAQSGALIVAGATTLAAGAANNITLTTTTNNFTGAVSVASGNNVSLRDANALDLGASTVSGTLAVTTNGALTQSGALAVGGATTLVAGAANSITLNNAGNDFTGAVAVTSGLNVSLADVNALVLGASTVSGTLGISTAGDITQTGTLAVTGATTLAAGAANNIALTTTTNNFTGAVSVASGNNVSLRDTNALALGASNVSGTLTVVTAGAVTQSGALSVTGATSLAAGATNDITLNNATNNFGGAVSTVSGRNVALTDGDAISLGASAVSGTLNINAGGAITQTGAVTVIGATTLAAGAANDITLTTATNNFANVAVTSGNNVSLSDSNGIALGTSTVASSLTVKAGGAVTQTGALAAPALNVSTYSTAGSAITLTNAGNDAATVNLQVATGTVAAPGTANANAAILYTDTNAVSVAGINSGTGGTAGAVTLLAGDAITQTGAIKASTLTASTANAAGATITLTHAGNDVITVNLQSRTGTVAAVGAANAGAAIQYTDANGFGTSGINNTGTGAGGDVTLVAGGAITQTGAIKAGVLSAKTLNNTPAAITLTNTGNDAASIVLQTRNAADTDRTAAAIAYTDANAVVIGGINAGSGSAATGSLALMATGAVTQTGAIIASGNTTFAAGAANNITLDNAGNDFTGTVSVTSGLNVALTDANALTLGASTVSGTLNLNSSGAITQTGTLAVTGAATLAAGAANNITLVTTTNDFAGTVSIVSGNNVSLRDTNSLALGGSTVGGNLVVTTNGALTQNGALGVGGATTLTAGALNSITLNNAGNDFTGAVAVTSGLNVSLADANALVLGASTVSGTLGVSTSGAITQTGTLAVTGATTLAAGVANDITLNTATNNFTGAVSVVSGNNVSLRDTNALALGSSTVGGTLVVTTNGALTQSGAVTVAGATTLAAGAANSITLNNTGNDFTGAVSVTSGLNVALVDANALALGASTVSGTLGINTSGTITQTGAVTVTGAMTLAAGAANDITLTTATNNFATVAVASGNNVALSDASGIVLGASTVASSLTVKAGGAVTQTGALVVPSLNVATYSAAGSAITLTNAGNDAATVNLQVATGTVAAPGTANANAAILYTDTNAVSVAGINSGTGGTAGAVTLVAGDAITQTGAIMASTLTATTRNNAGAAITLNHTANNAATLNLQVRDAAGSANSAAAIQYTDVNGVSISGINNGAGAGGNVTLVAGGAIAQTGAIKADVLSAKTLNNTPAAITLTNAGNDAASIVLQTRNAADADRTAAAIAYTDANAVVIGGINAGSGSAATGSFTLVAGGAVTQTGAVIAGGTTSITAGAANNVTLDNPANDFSGALSVVSGNGVSIKDVNALQLGAVTAATSLTLAAGGAITQTGAITTPTLIAKTLSAGTANITLSNAANQVNTVDLRARNLTDTANANGAISYRDATGFDVAAINTTGALSLQSNGNITQSGAIAAASLTVAGTGAGSLNLGTQANSIVTLNAITAAGGFTLNNGNNAVTVAGALNTTNSAVSIDTGTGAYTQNNFDVTAGSGPISITADTVNITANTGNNALTTSGVLTLKAKTASRTMSLAGAAGFDLTAAELTAIATGATGPIVIGDAASTGAMTIGGPVNLALKTLTLNAGSINDVGVQTITAQNVTLNANGQIGANASNGIDVAATNLSVNTTGNANAFVRSTGAINLGVGGLGSNVGTGTLSLTATGAVSQTAAITASGLALTGVGGAYTLGHSGNAVTTLAASTGSVDYRQAGALVVGTVGATAGVTATGAVKIETTGAASNLTLNNAVNSSATGDAVVLKAGSANAAGVSTGGQLVNNVGAGGIVAASGRYLVYSGDPGTTLEGVAGYSKRYNSDASYVPAGSANTFLYRVAPTLTVTADNKTKVYGDTNPLLTGVVSGLIDGDTVAGLGVNYTTTAVDRTAVAAGPVAITAGVGTNSENYTLALTNGALTITQRALTVSAAGQNRVYDGGVAATVALTDNRLSGDVLTATNTAASFIDKNVGTGKTVNVSGIALTGADAGNYSANTTAATTANITQRALTVGATGQNRVYDGGTVATVTLADNRIAGDVLTATNTAASFGDKNVGTGKAVSVSGIAVTGSDAGNYTYNTTAATTADITQRALTVSATGQNRVYDGGTAATVTLADNRVAGDVLATTNTAASFGDKNVGTGKTVNVSGIAVTGTDAGNYTFNTTAATTANITQRALTVGATAQNKVYDGGTAATVTLGDNRVAGDVLAASNTSASFADKNAGVGKTVNVGGIAITGTDAVNYSVNSTAATTASITPASIANVSGITAANKVQDGTTSATLATGGAAFTGRIGADVLTVGAATGNFDSPAVGNGKPVSITGITLSGADAGNYTLQNATAATTANITPAPASTAERTGDARIVNGTALPVLEGDERRQQSLRAAGIKDAEGGVAADVPTFRLAGFPDPRSAGLVLQDCAEQGRGLNCAGGGQGQ
jgi:trimeric autotransporter adhesin